MLEADQGAVRYDPGGGGDGGDDQVPPLSDLETAPAGHIVRGTFPVESQRVVDARLSQLVCPYRCLVWSVRFYNHPHTLFSMHLSFDV